MLWKRLLNTKYILSYVGPLYSRDILHVESMLNKKYIFAPE